MFVTVAFLFLSSNGKWNKVAVYIKCIKWNAFFFRNARRLLVVALLHDKKKRFVKKNYLNKNTIYLTLFVVLCMVGKCSLKKQESTWKEFELLFEITFTVKLRLVMPDIKLFMYIKTLIRWKCKLLLSIALLCFKYLQNLQIKKRQLFVLAYLLGLKMGTYLFDFAAYTVNACI